MKSQTGRHMNLGIQMFNVDVVQDSSSQGKNEWLKMIPIYNVPRSKEGAPLETLTQGRNDKGGFWVVVTPGVNTKRIWRDISST